MTNSTPKTITGEINRFCPSIINGLNDAQINERQNQGLINSSQKKYSKSYLSIFINNVCTFFNLLGLIVFIALLCVGAELFDFVFVLVYLANLTIGIVQEIRAKRCIDKLTILSNKNATVIRNGKKCEILPSEIVLDDIISLGFGNQIPTDSIVLEGQVEVNESLLTGESVPVKKQVGDSLLAGSFITSGVCLAKADKVGKDNYVETLSAKAKKYKKPQSELMDSLRKIIKTIGLVIVPIAILYFIKSYVLSSATINDAVKRTSTVVIGMIPSGMFLLTSLALAVGIIKLARHNTLVQDLYSLEMLARVDTICFDKTGTITDGKMEVREVVCLADNHNFNIENIISSMLGTLKDNNQTAIALYNKFGQNIYYKPTSSIPFNSCRKLSAVSFENMGTYSFGAPEFVLDEVEYENIKQTINNYASIGLRVLVLAHSNGYIDNDNLPKDFSAISLILIEDHIREDAISTIQWFKDNGVSIKVISGDNPITVAEVSKRVGIENADKYISLEGLSDQEVFDCANKYTVFGRVNPEQKAILVKAMKSEGHTTAMTGDGVNDILALKEADCAVTVASGSDAAKNIAHLVLMDNNFNSMPKIVFEGRRVINNIQSSASLYLMKTIFTMIMALLTFCLPYISIYPFTLKQMNLLEIFVIGLPSFFLSMQPNKDRVKGKFISYVISKSLPSAILMVFSVAVIEILQIILKLDSIVYSTELYRTMQIFALTFAGVISLYGICKPLNTYRSVLFFTILICLLGIFTLVTFNGFNQLGLLALSPLKVYWHHVLIVLCVILIDIPIFRALQYLCSKIKITK